MRPNDQRKKPITAIVFFLALLSLGACLKCANATAPTVTYCETLASYNEEETLSNVQNVAHEDEDTIFITEKSQENSSTTRVVTTTKVAEETTTVEGIETKAEDVESEEEVEVELEGEPVAYTEYELEYMAQVISQEAGGASEDIKIKVANVIVNRVLSDRYPDTVEGVLSQPSQYAEASTHDYPDWVYEDLDAEQRKKHKDECREIARLVLEGNKRPFPENVLFQASFIQGDGTYEYHPSRYGGYYFCYLNE